MKLGCGKLFLIVLGLGLLALFGGAAWQRYALSHWSPFNDPLLDRLARETRRQLKQGDTGSAPWQWIASVLNLPGRGAGRLDTSALNEWEGEFGGDPHYWEVRESQLFDEATYAKALAAGHFTPALLSKSSYWRLFDASQQNALAQVQRAIDAEPDNSWAYYVKCDLLLEQGDYAAALAACTSGNATARNVLPLPYELRTIHERRESITDPQVQMVCAAWLINSPLPDFLRRKKVFQRVGKLAAQGQQLELAEALWTRAMREGQMEGGQIIDKLVAPVNQVALYKDRKTRFISLGPEQLAELQELEDRGKAVRDWVKALNRIAAPGQVYRTKQQMLTADFRDAWLQTSALWQREDELDALLERRALCPLRAWRAGETAGYLTPEEARAKAPAAQAQEEARLQEQAEFERQGHEAIAKSAAEQQGLSAGKGDK